MKDKDLIQKDKYERIVSRAPKKITLLETKVPVLVKKDYENGYITRYFARQTNSIKSSIIEIDKKQLGKIRGDNTYFYKTISIDWKITGKLNSVLVNGVKEIGVLEANQNSINEAEKELPNISLVLNNLLQFYIGTGQNTKGFGDDLGYDDFEPDSGGSTNPGGNTSTSGGGGTY